MPAAWRRLHPYLLLTLLALPALWPLAGPGLPRTNDSLPHLFRAVALWPLLAGGAWLPRWSPHLVHGFGYPVFNFFPYGAHLLVAGLHGLGLGWVAAYQAACGAALLLSAFGAYRLGREHFGPAAGVVAAAAYLYSPYVLYDTYIRGSLPESLALALLPFALLGVRRAAHGHWPAAVWGGLALAAAIFCHHGVILQAMPFVVAYALFEAWEVRRESRERQEKRETHLHTYTLTHLLASTAPFTLAVLLTAFFTLPALFESRYAQIERGTANSAMSYTNNFLSLGELLALPNLPVDPDLLNPPVVRSLPLAALALAGLALLRWAWAGRQGRALPRARARALAFFALAALAAALLILPLSRPVWDAVPLLRLTLFPWRLLGPIALFVGIVAGALFGEEKESGEARGWKESAGLAGALVLLVVAGLPFAAPPREPVPAADPAALSLADVAAFEIPPDFIGTTTVGEYLPVWVRQLPDTAGNLARLRAGEAVERYEAPGASVQVLADGARGSTFAVQAEAPVTFTYRAFYFPGWHAWLDGEPVAPHITEPHGLMAVDVPAGAHNLRFEFGATPVRLLGEGLSALGLLATAAWLAAPAWLRRRGHAPPALAPAAPAVAGGAWLLGLAAVLALARPLLYDAGRTPLLRPGLADDGAALAGGPGTPLNLDFAGELTLLAVDVRTPSLPADAPARVDLYWKANHPLGIPYGFDVRLVDAAGRTWSEPDPARPRDWRFAPGTDFWPADHYLLDPYLLSPLPGTPPGDYDVLVTVFARHNLQAIGAQRVGVVTVSAPTRARACPDTLEASPFGPLDLRAAGFSASVAGPGDDVLAWLCWQAIAAPEAGLQAHLLLLDAAQQPVASFPFALGGPYPSGLWAPGDVLRDQITARLPAEIEAGDYTWAVAGAEGAPEGAPVSLGALAVRVPERTFEPPPVAHTLHADLGPVSLYGVTVPNTAAPGAGLPVTLVWHAQATPEQSLHAFVHLLAPDGTLAAQSDGVPADWTRRTTGWLPGEYVTDARTLTLPPNAPPGVYTLWAGLYDPVSGQRLVTEAFSDGRVRVGEVIVE